jgi:hypothetical protein
MPFIAQTRVISGYDTRMAGGTAKCIAACLPVLAELGARQDPGTALPTSLHGRTTEARTARMKVRPVTRKRNPLHICLSLPLHT